MEDSIKLQLKRGEMGVYQRTYDAINFVENFIGYGGAEHPTTADKIIWILRTRIIAEKKFHTRILSEKDARQWVRLRYPVDYEKIFGHPFKPDKDRMFIDIVANKEYELVKNDLYTEKALEEKRNAELHKCFNEALHKPFGAQPATKRSLEEEEGY